jgi:hypothetical protein
MTLLLLALSILNPAPAPAAETLCGKKVVCGTFEATAYGNRSTLIVSDGGEDKIVLAFERNGERQSEVTMHFRADGTFVFGEPGEEIGLGSCQDLTCYINTRPRLYEGRYLAIFQIFRFSEQEIVFEKLMSLSDGEQTKTKAVFPRKQ